MENLKKETVEEKIKNHAKKTEDKSKTNLDSVKLIAAIRIAGEVKKKTNIVETLDRLRLRRKYACTLINFNNKSLMGMLNEVKYYIAFGEIDKNTLIHLLKARAEKIKESGKIIKIKEEKINAEEIADKLMNGKKLIELGFKPFFRLHPPRKGIKSKLQYPKGVLGNNKNDINKLIMRML